jgi:hypothetical protein
MQVVFTKKEPPQWLLDMWKEIDDKTFGKGFDCFTEDAICNLGVADWHGREAIRNNLRQLQGLYRASRCRRVLVQPPAQGFSWQGWHEIR